MTTRKEPKLCSLPTDLGFYVTWRLLLWLCKALVWLLKWRSYFFVDNGKKRNYP